MEDYKKDKIVEYLHKNSQKIEREIVDLLREMVAQKTINVVPEKMSDFPYLKMRGEEYRVAKIVEREFKQAGIHYDIFEREKGRTNIIGRIGKGENEAVDRIGEGWEEFDPIIIEGNEGDVATSKFWLAYLRSMEKMISEMNGRVINCTEGGAKIQGAEVMTLEDAIDTYHPQIDLDCKFEAQVKSIHDFSLLETKKRRDGLEKHLLEGRDALCSILKIAGKKSQHKENKNIKAAWYAKRR